MSVEELIRFSVDLKNDKGLQDKLKKFGSDENAVVTFAQSMGYDFSIEELKSHAENVKGELSEEQLDKVAGGDVSWVYVAVVVVA